MLWKGLRGAGCARDRVRDVTGQQPSDCMQGPLSGAWCASPLGAAWLGTCADWASERSTVSVHMAQRVDDGVRLRGARTSMLRKTL